jgi:beta-N-acetylhexosaminidase
MGALSGSLAERSRAAITAGCDVVLHCSGELDEMQEVAAAVPVLAGRSAERAHAALARRKVSEKHATGELRAEWAALVSTTIESRRASS